MTTNEQSQKRERYAKAVREFNKSLNYYTMFAQAITSRLDVSVRPGTITSTDGKVVYIVPPIELANELTHDRLVCDKRLDTGVLACVACERTEAMNVLILHEIGHIICDSMGEFRTGNLYDKIIEASLHGTGHYQQKVKEAMSIRKLSAVASAPDLLELFPKYHTSAWMGAEDVRMENRIFSYRPGYETMVWHSVESILSNGIYQGETDTTITWIDQHEDAQLIMGIVGFCQGHDIGDRLTEGVVAAVSTDEFVEIMTEMPSEHSLDSVVQAVALVGYFNRLGFMQFEDEPEDQEPCPMPGEGDSEAGDGDDPADEGDTGERDEPSADDGDSDGESNESSNDDDSGSGAEAGDPSEENAPDHNSGEQNDDDAGTGGNPTDEDSDGSNSGSDSGVPEDEGNSPESDSEQHDGDGDSGNSGGDSDNSQHPGDGSGESSGNDNASGSDAGEDDSATDSSQESGTDKSDAQSSPAPTRDEEPLDDAEWEHVLGYLCEFNNMPELSAGDKGLLQVAIDQAESFDEYSRGTASLEIFDSTQLYLDGLLVEMNWHGKDDAEDVLKAWKIDPPNRDAISGTLMRARKVFSESKIDAHIRNLRSGRLNPRSLAGRAWQKDDDRLFHKRIRAEGVSFEVVIGMDISGSTQSNDSSAKIKQIAYSTAEILHKVEVDFSVYAHTTLSSDQAIIEVKPSHRRWDQRAKDELLQLFPGLGSFDGHNMEFYRKKLQRSTATRKLLIYFTDGHIPDTNRSEQVPIVRREVANFKRLGIALLVVGVHTDAPTSIGLDTVLVTDSTDLMTVIKQIEKRLV